MWMALDEVLKFLAQEVRSEDKSRWLFGGTYMAVLSK